MYRRIELIVHFPRLEGEEAAFHFKGGLCGILQPDQVADAWTDMPIPRRRVFKNCRFYFTEKGWKLYGRPTVRACQKTGQEYRVKCIKERSVDVFYKDEIQVMVRPLKKRS